jgi:hypothetical protein
MTCLAELGAGKRNRSHGLHAHFSTIFGTLGTPTGDLTRIRTVLPTCGGTRTETVSLR